MDRKGQTDQYAFEFLEKNEDPNTLFLFDTVQPSVVSLDEVRYEKSRKALVDSFRNSEFFRVMNRN